jgi:hypothetical protein
MLVLLVLCVLFVMQYIAGEKINVGFACTVWGDACFFICLRSMVPFRLKTTCALRKHKI